MKFLRISPIALSAALASAQTLSTIQLTITTCTGDCAATSDVAPSSFVYANTSVPVTTPTSSKKHRTTIYEYDTAYADSTFDVTKTICDENSLCYTTTDVESLATLTTTVDGILTILTTPVPVSSVPTLVGADLSSAAPASSVSSSAALSTLESVSASPASTPATSTPAASTAPATSTYPTASSSSSEPDTTLVSTLVVTPAAVYDTVSHNSVEWITRTQCHNDVCVTVVDKNTLTTYTTTENGILTVVTTFCPESLTSSAAPAATSTSAFTAPTTAPTTTANTILTETHASTTVVTITSCADNKCSKVPVTTGVTVVTTTVNDKVTEYTTYCPLTSETTEPVAPTSSATPAPPSSKAPVSEETTVTETHKSQTVITVTSCSDNKCSAKPVTTGLTTITDNETVYTTYCPLSETTAPAPSSSPAVSPEPVAPQTTSEVVASTINVITDNIVTETPPPVVTLVSSSTSQPPVPTVPTVTSYNVASSKQFAGILGLIVPFFVALI